MSTENRYDKVLFKLCLYNIYTAINCELLAFIISRVPSNDIFNTFPLTRAVTMFYEKNNQSLNNSSTFSNSTSSSSRKLK